MKNVKEFIKIIRVKWYSRRKSKIASKQTAQGTTINKYMYECMLLVSLNVVYNFRIIYEKHVFFLILYLYSYFFNYIVCKHVKNHLSVDVSTFMLIKIGGEDETGKNKLNDIVEDNRWGPIHISIHVTYAFLILYSVFVKFWIIYFVLSPILKTNVKENMTNGIKCSWNWNFSICNRSYPKDEKTCRNNKAERLDHTTSEELIKYYMPQVIKASKSGKNKNKNAWKMVTHLYS